MKKISAIFTAAVMAFSLALPASAAKHEDPAVAHITYADAPEGTVYTDILIKMTTDDESYTDFTQSPEVCKDGAKGGTSLGITADSEIAKYSEDGYISLSLHHKKALALCIYSNEEVLKMDPSCDFIDLSINYGDFKAAYIDAEGNILGVTSASETAYSMDTPYGFSTDGDSLTFQRHGAHPRTISIMIAAVALVLISLPIIIGFIVSKRKKRLKASERAKETQNDLK
ncbi:MAG: hypothetical protein J5582_16055 [Ruminococcus sp.]|uniref:hypothetical protein n=1 Tax=Ruminococcus sp. TaxID=41978 RepID=UPI0025F19FAC|nr:hypothetical protein [Ruminococcus sp.]MBO4868054.1 hypothetical protein [Ruminococcus sp.]